MIENKLGKNIRILTAHLFLAVIAVICLLPFVLIISASISRESDITRYGYQLLPHHITIDAYKTIICSSANLIKAYEITIITTIIGSVISIIVTMCSAYPLSRRDYQWGKKISFYFYFTMLFSGGAVPSYILISNYLHLKNNILVLIVPLIINVWNIFLLRTYFAQIPDSVHEAAEIDGANQFQILFTIIAPMSVTGIATILLFTLLRYWNEWYQCLMFITNDKMVTLQYYLSSVMSEVASMTKNQTTLAMGIDVSNVPNETARMAMCVLAAGPMLFAFSFFQKYFAKGLNVGSVKG